MTQREWIPGRNIIVLLRKPAADAEPEPEGLGLLIRPITMCLPALLLFAYLAGMVDGK